MVYAWEKYLLLGENDGILRSLKVRKERSLNFVFSRLANKIKRNRNIFILNGGTIGKRRDGFKRGGRGCKERVL